MNDFFKKSLQLLIGVDNFQMTKIVRPLASSRSLLIKKEGAIGGQLFGPIPTDCKRLFYNRDPDTWIWYEEWMDSNGFAKGITTEYTIRPTGVMKSQEGMPAHYIVDGELNSFLTATGMYYEQVTREIYHRDPTTGKLLAA